MSQDADEFDQKVISTYKYPNMRKTYVKDGKEVFVLDIVEGKFNNSQITVLVGENGTGKTTFIKMLAGKDKDFKD
jgi:ATP-binding cassette, sub-family E, member 1